MVLNENSYYHKFVTFLLRLKLDVAVMLQCDVTYNTTMGHLTDIAMLRPFCKVTGTSRGQRTVTKLIYVDYSDTAILMDFKIL
jgi:hypothetical protein